MSETITEKAPNEEDLTLVGFKPGLGTVYVDKSGKKWIKRRVESMEHHLSQSTKFRDKDGHKIHMSKKARRELHKQYREYLDKQKKVED